MAVTTKDKPVNGKAATILGSRWYYADGTIVTVSKKQEILNAPLSGIQVVVVFFEETYMTFIPETGVEEARNYRLVLCNENVRPSADYFWMATDGSIGAGGVGEPPQGAVIKIGTLMPYPEYKAILIRASFDHIWGASPPPPQVFGEANPPDGT